jgi:polyhydroxyalkanoate synthesis regulator phasin
LGTKKTEGAIKNGRHWQYWAQKKQKVQSRMVDTGNIGHKKNRRCNQEWSTLAILGTKKQAKDTQNKQKTPQHKIKKMSNTDPTKKTGVNPGASEV